MERNQGRNSNIVYGICTNTGGKKDGTPCSKCQNKEKQAIRASKDFVCEECGEPLTKVDPPAPKLPKWVILALVLLVVGCGIGAYFAFFNISKDKASVMLTLNKETISLNVGDSDKLIATVTTLPTDADVSVSFALDNEKVAQVDNNGLVHASAKGEAAIIVIARTEVGATDTAKVKVVVKEDDTPTPNDYDKVGTEKTTIKNWGTYDLGWGVYNGPMKDGKPHGERGTVKVTSTHDIELGSTNQKTLTVYPGETIVTKYENGRLRAGEVLNRKDGLFSIF